MALSKEERAEELGMLIGESIFVVTRSDQLNLFGQTFRPIFVGTLREVGEGHLTLDPATVKMVTAPFFQFPVPLSIPLENIAHFTRNFAADKVFPLT